MLKRVLKNKIFSNVSWIIIGKIFQMIISLLVGMLTARYLGPTNYGIIGYVTSFITFITAFCTLGLNNIIIKELIDNKDKQGEIVWTCTVMKFIASLISTILLNIVIMIIHNGNREMILITILSSISVLFNSTDTINYWYQSKLEAKKISIISTIAYAISSIYKVLVIFLNKDVVWVAFATTFDAIIIALVLLFMYKRDKGQKFIFSIETAKNLFKQSYHFILSGLMVSIYAQMDKIMIGSVLNVTEVGFYTTAVTISTLWSFVPNAIIQTASPVINDAKNNNNDKYIRRLKQLYAALVYLSILYSIFVTIFAKPIILILYGKQYLASIPALKIVVWYCAFSFLGVAKNIWLVCEGKQKYEKWFTLLGAATNLLLNTILIPQYGIVGAAIATLITQISTNFIYPVFFKETRINSKYIIESFLLKDILPKEFKFNKILKLNK